MKKSDEELREEMRARIFAPQKPPLEATQKFLRTYCLDNSPAEAEAFIASMAQQNTATLRQGLGGLEALLANPPADENVLRDLVLLHAQWPLPGDNSDEGAKVVLRGLAQIVRKHLVAVGVPPTGDVSA